MKYIYLVKSNYHGDNAQGNVLGAHSSLPSARDHYDDILKDRMKRSKIAWQAGADNTPEEFVGPSRRMAAFYVIDDTHPETVEILKQHVCTLHKKGKHGRSSKGR